MVPDREAIAEIDDGRERLVQAAARILVDGDGQLLHDGLTQKALSVLTQKHPSNFQSHFSSKVELFEALTESLTGSLRVDDFDAEVEAMRELSLAGGSGMDIGAALRHISTRFEAGTPDGERARALLALWAVAHRDPELGPSVSKAFSRSEPDLVFLLGGIGEKSGLSLRSPWDPDRLGTILRALLYGLEVQESARPGSTKDLVYLTLVSLLPVMTRFEHEEMLTVEDLVAQMGASIAGYWTEDDRKPLNASGRDALFLALESQLEETGYNSTTLAGVASRAELNYESVAKTMGNLNQLVCHGLRERLEPVAGEIALDSASNLFDTGQVVERHVVRLASAAHGSLALTRALLAMRCGGAAPSPAAEQLIADLGAPVVPLLEELAAPDEVASAVDRARAIVSQALSHVSLGGDPDHLPGISSQSASEQPAS